MWVGITVIIITVLTITFFCINFGCGGSDSMDAGTGCCDTVISWVIDRTVGCTQSKISSVTVVLALLGEIPLPPLSLPHRPLSLRSTTWGSVDAVFGGYTITVPVDTRLTLIDKSAHIHDNIWMQRLP